MYHAHTFRTMFAASKSHWSHDILCGSVDHTCLILLLTSISEYVRPSWGKMPSDLLTLIGPTSSIVLGGYYELGAKVKHGTEMCEHQLIMHYLGIVERVAVLGWLRSHAGLITSINGYGLRLRE